MNRFLASFAILGAMILAGAAVAQSAGRGFSNITEKSGVAEIVRKHYEFQPKLWLSGITLADLDGDGHLDLLVGGHGCVGSAGRNDGKGHFVFVDPQFDASRGRSKSPAVPYPGGEIRLIYDFNEDGKLDVLASYGDGQGVAYLNECTAGDRPVWNFKTFSPGFDPFSRSVAMADLNRDGIVDYIFAGDGRGTRASIVFGKGGGSWEGGTTIEALKESGAIPVDINGDGYLDLLVSQRGYNPSKRLIFLNSGNSGSGNSGSGSSSGGKMSFREATKECGLDSDAGSIHGYGDLTGKGRIDLICVEGREIVIYLNDGKGHFTKGPPIRGMEQARGRPTTGNWGGAVVTDFDNDGIPDILVNGRYFIYLLHGLGGGRFELANQKWGLPTELHPAVDEGACFGDIDNDGMLDIITMGPDRPGDRHDIAVYHNDLPKLNFINVQLIGVKGNTGATNATIRVYEPGGLNDPARLFWSEQIGIWGRQSFHSYYFAAHTERHIGLGKRSSVDVSVEFYPSGKKVESRGAAAGKILRVEESSSRGEEIDLK